jgi:hypothetical protein
MSSPTDRRGTVENTTTKADLLTPEQHADLLARGHVGEFEILDKLGEGALSQVYLARQGSLGRHVALKVNKRAGGDLAEGPLLAGLEHDHIVKVFSAFTDPASGARGLCLQYVPGADLGAVIRHVHEREEVPQSGRAILAALDAHKKGEARFDPASLRDRDALAADDFTQAVCRIGQRLAEALAFAHARGVLHCDIKPANILMTQYGRPMLADFNVSFDREREPSPTVGGTLPYMSPEHRAAVNRAGGWVDERSDLFSLGVVLHELATGVRPSAEGAARALDRVPRELAAVIRRCLQYDPADRYQTAADLAAALGGAWQLLAARRALPPAGRVGRWAVANPVRALALAAILPHIAASVVNIGYNAVEIELKPAQERAFLWMVVGYNLVIYPLCVGTAFVLFWRIARALRGPSVEVSRARVRQLGWWAIGLGALGWLPGGLLFPLVIDLAAGPVGWQTYAHYVVSFTLAGLIGVVFSYLGIEYVAFRALFPRLGNPDGYAPGKMWAELRPLTGLFGPFLLLACAVPLVGAILLIVFGDEKMTLGFRLLVAGLIGVGVAGVGIAERVTRRLRTLAAVWQRDAGDTPNTSTF